MASSSQASAAILSLTLAAVWWTVSGESSCSPGTDGPAEEAAAWPSTRGYTFQDFPTQMNNGTGSYRVHRYGLATIERILQQNGLRQARRLETPSLIVAYTAGLGELLETLNATTRASMCPGLAGLTAKDSLRKNVNIFFFGLRLMPDEYILPYRWDLSGMPADLSMLNRSATGWLLLRDERYHSPEHLHIVQSSDMDAITKILRERKEDSSSNVTLTWSAIEYIRPHLFDGRKWDFIVHVLVVGTDPVRIFLGGPELSYMRIATSKFAFDDLSLDAHHLVINYLQTEIARGGHERFLRRLDLAKPLFAAEEWDRVWLQVEKAVKLTILAVEPRIRDEGHKLLMHGTQCYELLEFNFMLDERAKVFLLEVTRNVASESVMDTRIPIFSQMMHDLLCVVGASCSHASRGSVYSIPEWERERLQPFEAAADDLERLTDNYARQLARAARTGFVSLWPSGSIASSVAQTNQTMSLAAAMDVTDEWAPSLYTRRLLPAVPELQHVRWIGVPSPDDMVWSG